MERGTSSVPMVLGVVGGVLGLPAALCSGACAAGLTASVSTGNFYLYLGLLGAILGIVFGCLSKARPKLSAIMLFIATALVAVTLVTFNFLSLIVVALLLLAAILCLTQKKEIIQ